ncbi:nuclear matrix constituent protein 1-like isoform X2 [Tasmannia lanceolata]|uniref:nuclear matrix constituent protein 1-like isoform X2 n=1 Tax=Tasmannia lanceolata TaxID=3420 RepID=UPI00406294ED
MMFTPQKKGWPGFSISPRTEVSSNPRNGGVGKGKSVAVVDGPHPPLSLLGENGGNAVVGFDGGGEGEVWRQFREAGLLDEVSMEKKNREAFFQRISKLENELYEYQYTMGLLLIEKKEWISKYDELRQALEEAEEMLKREQAAHLIAMSEVEKRDENLKKALGVEKQCVSDLEKVLHEMRTESAENKFTSDKMLAEAQALVAGIEEKALEVEAKLRAADAKLAEASRKSSEIERKLEDVDARERELRRERLSLNAEKNAHESDLSNQREEYRDWERKLQEAQQRLFESQGLLNQREDRANTKDRLLIQKERDLEEAQKKIEITNSNLNKKEADISARLTSLAVKKEEADVQKSNLEVKERDLLALEQKLTVRENMAIQKLVDEHNAILDKKKSDFELEMDQKRKSQDEELKNKLNAAKQREEGIGHKEEKLVRREQTLEKKSEKLREKEKDYESKLKDLKEREKSVKVEEKALETEKKQVEADKQEVLNLMAELEKGRAALKEQELHILKEQESLKVTETERSEYLRLQSELKLEINECRTLKHSLTLEREDLKQQRDKFERDWEALDERKVIEKELNEVNEEREKLIRWKQDEEERLKSEKLALEAHMQRERESFRLENEAFRATMEHERSEIFEKAERDREVIRLNVDVHKRTLDAVLQSMTEERDKKLQEKEGEFEEYRDREMIHINSLKGQAQRGMEEMRLERQMIEREQQKISTSRKDLERNRFDIQKDIEKLDIISRNLKDQREELIRERRHFLALVEQHKSCRNCGELVLSDFQPLPEVEHREVVLLPRLSEGYLKETMEGRMAPDENLTIEMSPLGGTIPNSASPGGRMSWFQKCTSRIFKFSPGKRADDTTQGQSDGLPLFSMQDNREASHGLDEAEDELEPSLGLASDSFVIHEIQSDNSTREMEGEPTQSVDEKSDTARAQGVGVLSASPENVQDSQPLVTKSMRRNPGRKGKLRATRSVKQVIEEARAFIGETSEQNKDEPPNGKAEDLAQINEESLGNSIHTDRKTTNVGRKRQHTQEADDSEARSDSVTTGGRRKRRQTIAPEIQSPGGKRYNLRRSTVAGAAAAAQALPDRTVGTEKENHGSSGLPEKVADVGGKLEEQDPNLEFTNAPLVGVANEIDTSIPLVQKTMTESIVQKIVRPEMREIRTDTGGSVDMELVDGTEFSEQSEDSEDGCWDEGDDSEIGNASIGKKLWNFFTT